jgi:DNA polymerase-3 subunit delta'
MSSYPWQQHQREYFNRLYKQKRIPHAILITGVEGLGQRDYTDWLVAAIHCENNTDAETTCGQCHNCQLLASGHHPDHIVISPEETGKQLKIEQIRALKEKQNLTSHISQAKTVIIEPADAMTISAYNSLLKLLEEPSNETTLILLSHKPEKLPITILSRCQRISLSVPAEEDACNWLINQGYRNEDIKPLLGLCKGAPLSTQALLDSGYSETLSSIKADFKQLILNKANPIVIAESWKNHDLELVFNYLQSLIKQSLVKFSLDRDKGKQQRYWMIYDCITETIKLLSSSHNLNKVLLIEQFMVSVMDAGQAKNASEVG